jgi:hypothetical protein
MKYEVRSMNFKFEFLPSNFLLRKLCGTLCKSLSTLWLNLAYLPIGQLNRISVKVKVYQLDRGALFL